MTIERTSSTWITIDAWAKDAIEAARDNLENADDSEERGRIAALRELLRLADNPQAQAAVVDYHS